MGYYRPKKYRFPEIYKQLESIGFGKSASLKVFKTLQMSMNGELTSLMLFSGEGGVGDGGGCTLEQWVIPLAAEELWGLVGRCASKS